jgi:hypothetical protein
MSDKKDMTYDELIQGYRDKGYELERYGQVKEIVRDQPRYYPLYKIIINPDYEKTLLITTGFHGEEFNGPISILNIFDEAVDFAKERRARYILYPCINPSGFDLHKRYNASDEEQNNDFMRYELEDGKLVGILQPGEKFITYKPIKSPAKEVRYLQRDLDKMEVDPHAVLDVHQQQGCLENGDFYAYYYDNRADCLEIMEEIGTFAKVARKGSAWNFDDNGRLIKCQIDDDGLVLLHDGSITDWFYRRGRKNSICAETNTDLPVDKVGMVNLAWIKGLTKLITK